jgi:2-polyprenyl-3-methyl-5-hydroxy-6-metoxy-1,4-benzoquinol methylase
MPKDYRAITRQTYEEIAPDYAERDHRLEEDEGPLVRETLSAFAEKVGREGRVLDVGSGGGRDSRGLLSMGFEVVGIDNAEGMIRQSKSVEPGINYLVMDFEKLDFPPHPLTESGPMPHFIMSRKKTFLRYCGRYFRFSSRAAISSSL